MNIIVHNNEPIDDSAYQYHQQQHIEHTNEQTVCPNCAGYNVRVSLVSNKKGDCSTCKSKKTMGKQRNKIPTGQDPEQQTPLQIQPVSVISVNVKNKSPKSANGKKGTSLFGKLFQKGDSKNSTKIDGNNRKSGDSPITSLEVKSSKVAIVKSHSVTYHTPNYSVQADNENNYDINNGDKCSRYLCVKCNKNPAQLSVTNSKEMTCERLCNGCHVIMQQPSNKTATNSSLLAPNNSSSNNSSNNASPILSVNKRTVIKVQESNTKINNNNNNNSNTDVDDLKMLLNDKTSSEKLLKMLENAKSEEVVANESQEISIPTPTNTPADVQTHTNVINVTLPQSSQHIIIRQSIIQPDKDSKPPTNEHQDEGLPVSVLTIQNQRGNFVVKTTTTTTTTADTATTMTTTILTPSSLLTSSSSTAVSSATLAASAAISSAVRAVASAVAADEKVESDSVDTIPDEDSNYLQEDFSDEESIASRPAPFNPNYNNNNNSNNTHRRQNNNNSVRSNISQHSLPSELAVNRNSITNFQSKAEEVLHTNNQRQQHQQLLQMYNPRSNNNNNNNNHNNTSGTLSSLSSLPYSAAPPRYEDIIKENHLDTLFNEPTSPPQPQQQTDTSLSPPSSTTITSTPSSYLVYYLKHFGKYSELSTQPGGLSNPTTIKLSHYNNNNDNDNNKDVVAVTNPSLSNIQVFSMAGECLAVVKVNSVRCSCPISHQMLAVATDRKLSMYDYNGVEKASIDIIGSSGRGVNSINSLKSSEMFVVVACSGSVALYDCRFSAVVHIKTFTTADGHKKTFGNVVDVATTSKDDLVVLDGGSSSSPSSHSCIFVINMATNQLKSAIYPKHEICGSLSNPTSLTVDSHNRIIVSDSGHKRLLIFSVAGGRASGNNNGISGNDGSASGILVKIITGLKLSGKDVPKIIDVGRDGLLFVVVVGKNDNSIRVDVYSAH